MANCAECGKKFGFLEAGTDGLCSKCEYLANMDHDSIELYARGRPKTVAQLSRSSNRQLPQHLTSKSLGFGVAAV